MIELYTWDTEAQAQAALDNINSSQVLPIIGVNAKTGEPQPDKAKTLKWAEQIISFTNGKFGFQRVPEEYLTAVGIPAAQQQAWLDAFNPVIIDYDENLIPVNPSEEE